MIDKTKLPAPALPFVVFRQEAHRNHSGDGVEERNQRTRSENAPDDAGEDQEINTQHQPEVTPWPA